MLWIYDTDESQFLERADRLLEAAAPAAREGGNALLAAKRKLHRSGVGTATVPAQVGGDGLRYAVQVALQFLAGYRDLNLRDAAHIGHGAILCQDPAWCDRIELANVLDGELIGIAATEPTGGSNLASISTLAIPTPAGWEITGQKRWVSRLWEAGAFVTFARSPHDISAFYVPNGSNGLSATPVASAGLPGWSWGTLDFTAVRVPATALVGSASDGESIFRRHFASYRPLVAATCLGGAAASIDHWANFVLSRSDGGRLLLGGVMEAIGEGRSRVMLTLSGLIAGAASHAILDPTWSKMVKAQAVLTSLHVVRTALQRMGAGSFEAEHPVRRIAQDLEAFQYADGATDPLLRSAGQRFVQDFAALPRGRWRPG